MTKPDIIFIVLDTQRADRLGVYGNQKNISPNIDQFAAQSTVFENAISAAQWTIPSHASMFTGLYPTAHQLTQSHLTLGPDTHHAAEILRSAGYETVGFCNNPLVGVLENGLNRGFEQFYNYAGTFPNRPQFVERSSWQKLRERYEEFMRKRLALPIQNFFGRSESAFSLSLNKWFTPLWSKFLNFKGQNELSIQDVIRFLAQQDQQEQDKPLFLFYNLMETHLPFYPPKQFVDQMAPNIANDRRARRIMREWNSEAYRWSAPPLNGLTDLEWEVLNGYYDAEVLYQDDYLKPLFEALAVRKNRENTLTIIVGDHGDGLGEHGYFGHSFVAYQELLHVPLIINWPHELDPGQRVSQPVSTRRVFHTMLQAAGELPGEQWPNLNDGEIRGLSLREVAHGRDVEQATAYAEVYPPTNIVKSIEDRQPEIIEKFGLLQMRRAIVQENLKLIQVDDQPAELFDLKQDDLELDSLLEVKQDQSTSLNHQLNRMVGTVENQRDSLLAGVPLDIDEDSELIQHLRGLGYID